MIQFDIRAHKEAMASLKTMERTLERECDNQLEAIDRTIGVWEGTAAQRFRSEYSSMLRMGEYASLQMQINGMYRVMEEALWEMTSLKNKCENFYSTLTGEEWVRWSLGDYGSPSSLLMADRGVIVSLCQEFDNLCEANRNACDVLESVIDECGGLIDFGGELEELRSMREKMNRVQNLREAMDSYSRQLVSLDKDLSIRYSQWIDEDILSKIAAPQRIASLLAGDETAIAEFEKLIDNGIFSPELAEYIAKDYAEAIKQTDVTWEEVALTLYRYALNKGTAVTALEKELIRWGNAQVRLTELYQNGSEAEQFECVQELLQKNCWTEMELGYLCSCMERYASLGDAEKLKRVTAILLEGTVEKRDTANGKVEYYVVAPNEEKLQALMDIAVAYGAYNFYNYALTLQQAYIPLTYAQNPEECNFYLLSETDRNGISRVMICIQTDADGNGGNSEILFQSDFGVALMSEEEVRRLNSNTGNHNLFARWLSEDKEEEYKKKQYMEDAIRRFDRQHAAETIEEYGLEEYLPYLHGDVPYIDGAELDEWNRKRIKAHEMLAEWEAQGIDMKLIEEYYYYQCGLESLKAKEQAAKEDPVGSSFISFGEKLIGNISSSVYEATCYITGNTVDSEAAWYLPEKRAEITRATVGGMISDSVDGKEGEYLEKGYYILMATGDFVVESVAEAAVGGVILDKVEDICKAVRTVDKVDDGLDTLRDISKADDRFPGNPSANWMTPEEAEKYLDFLEHGSKEGLTDAELIGISKADAQTALNKVNYQDVLDLRKADRVVEDGTSAKGLIGHDFEDYLSKTIGGEGSFSVGGRDFDGGIGNRWWEAKSGNYWSMLEENPNKLAKFKSDMGDRLRIATENGATYEIFSNTSIPESIKQWLTKKGITFTELLD